MKKILFTGGGSAGHVIPNLALIDDLLALGNVDVCYMGTEGIEKQIVSERKLPYYTISCPKLVRGGLKSLPKNLKIPFALRRAIKEAEKGLLLYKPDLVFSKGGYVGLPVVYAAKKLKIPCFAHESDFSVGLANRMSAKKCRYVFTSFPETADTVPNGKYSGAPIRRSLFSYERESARKRLHIPQNAKVLLVFGGGSGSVAINDGIRRNLKSLTEKYLILHVCGRGNTVRSEFKNYIQEEFVTEMGLYYAAADVVLSRAGSGTVFELVALKKPAILIPLVGQTRGDQAQNAEYFQKRGLCRVLRQNELMHLTDEIDAAFADKELRDALAEQNLAFGNDNILRELRATLRL